MTAPDLTQKVLGFREFVVYPDASRWLRSIAMDHVWQPGPNHASCHLLPSHTAPYPDCECGLYAWHDVPRLWWHAWIPAAVLAWGRMQVHHDGFRAEHAEIVLLGYQPYDKERVAECAAHYGVRAVPIETLREEARLLGAPIPETLRPSRADREAWWDQQLTPSRTPVRRAGGWLVVSIWLSTALANLVAFGLIRNPFNLGVGIALLIAFVIEV